MFNQITVELDDIATQLERKGEKRLAAKVDAVTNTLTKYDKQRLSSRRYSDLNAQNIPDELRSGRAVNEGWEDADEGGYYGQPLSEGKMSPYNADKYHKFPVGKDSMSKFLGRPAPTPDNIPIGEPGDPIEEGDYEVNIQASRNRRANNRNNKISFWGNANRRYAETSLGDHDPGDPLDVFSTAGLPESGDEDKTPPIDKNETGDKLEFYSNTEPAGSLHMHGKAASALAAREVLRKAADIREAGDIIVEDPEDLQNSEDGEDVQRDQYHGVYGNRRRAKEDDEEDDDEMEVELDDDDEEDKEANVEYAKRK